MLPRTLEPEVMESAEEARDYNAMDHSRVNAAFVDDFLAAVRRSSIPPLLQETDRHLSVLDCGTGTALIPILLARTSELTSVTAVDLSLEMLRLAADNVAHAGLASRILLRQADGKQLPFDDNTFDAVISNSIVHHIPDPEPALAEMIRVLRPGGLLFVRDLMRPATLDEVERLVDVYASDESERQQELFRDSLHAALTLGEIGELLSNLELPISMASQTSDRHWTVTGIPKSV